MLTIPKRFLPRVFRRVLSLWPPYLAAGIRVDEIAPDFSRIRVSLSLRWFNRNYVGTHFGGSLFAMTDPFYMLMLIQRLGSRYIVWDKASSIEFLKPGRGRVRVEFVMPDDEVARLRAAADEGEKVLPEYTVEVMDEEGTVVARVHKTLYIRKKHAA